MAPVKQKLATFNRALKTLDVALEYYKKQAEQREQSPTHAHELAFLSARDSIIQRFEYCVDLFWKVLKVYLEHVEKVTLTTYSPKGIIREASQTKIISEKDAEACIAMVNERNNTSHMYHEEIAEEIARKVPHFYLLMASIAKFLTEQVESHN